MCVISVLALLIGACCDDSQPQLALIPWGPDAVEAGLSISVGDTLPVRAEVHGHGGFFEVCLLYDSDDDFARFEFALDDASIADFVRGGEHHYVVARRPGMATLKVTAVGVDSLFVPFEVLEQ